MYKLEFLPRRILYLAQFPHIGGGETALIYLLSKLDRKRFEPIVIVPQNGQLSNRLHKLSITTYSLPLELYLIRTFFVPGMSFKNIYQFFKLVKKIKPDLIHINHLNLAVYAGIAGKLSSIPVVATAHGPWDSYYFYQDIISNIFVDKILANTPKVAHQLLKRKLINPSKVSVCYFGIDTNFFKPKSKSFARENLALPKKDLIITIVGRLDPIKDHLTFLQAANIVQQTVAKVTFLIVGSTLGDFSKMTSKDSHYRKDINNYLSKHPNLKKRTIFKDFIDFMPSVYQATDILVSSSLSESFGLSLAEASSCAIPVIATNQGGQRYIIRDGETGFLIPPKNPKLLVQKILQLVYNSKLRQEFGLNGRKHILANFSLNESTEIIQNYYLNLIEHK